MNQLKTLIFVISFLIFLTLSTTVFAAGFEKTVMWSGKWAGLASAAAGGVTGAESLFYNPAGLVQEEANDVTIGYSPLLTRTEGAQTMKDEHLKSEKNVKHLPSITSKYSLTKDWALGLGAYVSGGTGSEFKGIDYSGVNANYRDLKPDVESAVSILEIGLGSAYRINSHFSVGATWRTSIAQAEFSSADISTTVAGRPLVNTRFNNMKGENYEGFRLGAQYVGDEKKWGVGASYRSSINLELDGSAEGKAEFITGTDMTMTGGQNVSLATVFPEQFNLGSFYKYNDQGTLFLEYSFTNYSKNQDIAITGDPLYLSTTNVLAGKTIALKWQDAHAVKIGHEYKFKSWDWRAGYAFTSPVTSDQNVSITFSAPALGHSFTTGAGTKFMDDRLHLDLAAEYSVSQGDGTRGSTGVSGEYKSSALGLHSSLKYLF